MIDECYPEEVKIGFIKVSTSNAIKELDPIAWRIAKSDYVSRLEEDASLLEFGGYYYWFYEVEELIKGST